MAAFLYLELYFAYNEPQNPAFAHNFIILAPSGLKSSVVPSLKTIRNFDPTWVIAEPTASKLKQLLCFEVLDQGKSAKSSNQVKNPNAQKISNYQSNPFGLVLVTNAEKVILDRAEVKEGLDGQYRLYELNNDERDREANELRNLIGKLPALSIFIDEVHHAVNSEIKLRAVVNHWTANGTINSVIGFSGTPYLEKPETVAISKTLSVSMGEISNTVYYYPLSDGVGNFLKRPIVKIESGSDSSQIIENGVRMFFDHYRNTVYSDGTAAKLGIYCGSIEKLETVVRPLVEEILKEYDLSPNVILRFHKGNKEYRQPEGSQRQFETLDQPSSKIRVVLLVQVGKEGWDCRSLTGIILSQEGDCPKNMVLQTSCRCLRQVDRTGEETALIYLNASNGNKLVEQLRKQHHISLNEFQSVQSDGKVPIKYDRTEHLKLPRLDFCQLKIKYEAYQTEPLNISQDIIDSVHSRKNPAIIRTLDEQAVLSEIKSDDTEKGTERAVFHQWLYFIAKESFGTLSMQSMLRFESELRTVFDTVTYQREGQRFFSSRYNQAVVRANIRRAFCEKRSFTAKEEADPQSVSLLHAANFERFQPLPEADYYPEQSEVKRIILADQGKGGMTPDVAAAIAVMEASEDPEIRQGAAKLRKQKTPDPNWERTYHYLPYHRGSGPEEKFLNNTLLLPEVKSFGLEIYYNGDSRLTEFRIKCYKRSTNGWKYIGLYTPDFLIIQRKDGEIYKVLIVEIKGEGYAHDPDFQDRRNFTENDFIRLNSEAFGYKRFDYLYLEDSELETDGIVKTQWKIVEFFGGNRGG